MAEAVEVKFGEGRACRRWRSDGGVRGDHMRSILRQEPESEVVRTQLSALVPNLVVDVLLCPSVPCSEVEEGAKGERGKKLKGLTPCSARWFGLAEHCSG